MSRSIRLRHAVAPLIALPARSGFRLDFSVSAPYDPEIVARWAFEIAPRLGATRLPVWTSDTVGIDGQSISLNYAPADASAADENVALSDVEDLVSCEWALTAYDDADVLLWRIQGDVDFAPARGIPDGVSASPAALTITIDPGEAISLAVAMGADGQDGREPELRSNAGRLEWRYVGGTTWTDLGAIGGEVP